MAIFLNNARINFATIAKKTGHSHSYHGGVSSLVHTASAPVSSSALAAPSSLNPEMVQQMILSTFLLSVSQVNIIPNRLFGT